MKVNGVAKTTKRSRDTEKLATMTMQRWGPVEDAELMSGKTEGELVLLLGRTIRAIQRRKWQLRRMDQENK